MFRRSQQQPVVCYADANFGSENDRKSTSGFLVQVFGNSVHWATRRQSAVALSSTEAEYIALATAAAELLWIRNLLDDLKVQYQEPLVIHEDNQACIKLLQKWEHKRLKHIDVKYNFVRELSEQKVIDVRYINTKKQRADIFTKGLPREQLRDLRRQLGLVYT